MPYKQFEPDFSKIAEFRLGTAKNQDDAGCLWSDSSGNPITLPVGTVECIAGTKFVCRIDGAWANTFESCIAADEG
jgi:hypothetical protein